MVIIRISWKSRFFSKNIYYNIENNGIKWYILIYYIVENMGGQMNIIAKHEISYKGKNYVFVVYDDNTYEFFLIDDFKKKFPKEKSGNYGKISKSKMNEMKDSISQNSKNNGHSDDSPVINFFKIMGMILILVLVVGLLGTLGIIK